MTDTLLYVVNTGDLGDGAVHVPADSYQSSGEQQASGSRPTVRPHGHWCRQSCSLTVSNLNIGSCPSWHYILLYHHSHRRDNVTAPHGCPNLRSRLHSCHAQEERTTKSTRTCGGIGPPPPKKNIGSCCDCN